MFITDKLCSLTVHGPPTQVIYILNRHEPGSVCLPNSFASVVCLEMLLFDEILESTFGDNRK